MKLKYHKRGFMWVTQTSAGFLRVGKDGYWSSRWVTFNLFGSRKRNRIRRTRVDNKYTRVRHQRVYMWWIPFVMVYHVINTLDEIEIISLTKGDLKWVGMHSPN